MIDCCPHCGGELYASAAYWAPVRILEAARTWAEANGRQPKARDWKNGRLEHPAASHVVTVFGSWNAMIAAAGYEPISPSRPWRKWTREDVVESMLSWVVRHGRWPVFREWDEANEHHPHRNTVLRLFGTWDAARREAGYTGPRYAKNRSLKRNLRPLARAAATGEVVDPDIPRCNGCGGDLDVKTTGCKTCWNRHKRREQAREPVAA